MHFAGSVLMPHLNSTLSSFRSNMVYATSFLQVFSQVNFSFILPITLMLHLLTPLHEPLLDEQVCFFVLPTNKHVIVSSVEHGAFMHTIGSSLRMITFLTAAPLRLDLSTLNE